MKIGISLAASALLLSASPSLLVRAENDEDSGDGSGDYDDWFVFDDGTKWDDYALYAKNCMNYNSKDVVVFEMYGEGHNQCSKKRVGTYTADVADFVKAYAKQQETDADLQGYGYDEPEALGYLECTGVEYNDDYYYVKLGCNAPQGFRINTYTDADCTNEVNLNVGLYSDVKIQFGSCRSCVNWPAQNNNNNNGDEEEEGQDVDDQFEYYHAYDSPMCGAMWAYKESCNRKCKKLSNKASSTSSSSHKRRFTGWGKFWLFVFSCTGVGLIALILQMRKRMSRGDALVEEAAIEGAGIKKKWVAPLAIGTIFLILFFMVFRLKFLTWLFLLGTNVALLWYFVRLRKSDQKEQAETGYVAEGSGP